MKITAPTFTEPLLEDRAASCFGAAGQPFPIRARRSLTGSLVLTEESLIFTQGENGAAVEIPIHEIHGLGMGRWHEGTASFVPVLRITYRNNLILGVQVAHPEKWIEAIEAVALRRNLPPLAKEELLGRSPFRHSRFIIIGILIVALLGTILPAFFSWMHRATLGERGIQTEPAGSSFQESAG